MCIDAISYLLGKKNGGGGSSSDLDWSAIGYSSEPQSIKNDYLYAKEIYDNWDNSVTSLQKKFQNDYKLRFMPLVDTSNATTMNYMFQNCYALTQVPLLDTSNVLYTSQMFEMCVNLESVLLFNTSKVTGGFSQMFNGCSSLKDVPLFNTSLATNMNSMFLGCPSLTNTSLDNILQMCINATNYKNTKTLVSIGLRDTDYPASRIEALPHYQDFIDAGWTTGY